jgi:acyl-coenzyme A synthetase/AMP-(fatty) acid ligase
VAHRALPGAVVGRPHEIKGEAVFAYVVLRGASHRGRSALVKGSATVGQQVGAS